MQATCERELKKRIESFNSGPLNDVANRLALYARIETSTAEYAIWRECFSRLLRRHPTAAAFELLFMLEKLDELPKEPLHD